MFNAFGKLWTIAWRDLGRNRRRTFFSVLAVGMGLGLLILLNGYIKGVMDESLENAIRLETGHLQLRAPSYEPEQSSLLWEDLLESPSALAGQAAALSEVETAAPVLWAGGYLNTRDESVGLRIYGIDTASALYTPFRETMIRGEFIAQDDRSGILIGRRLADSLKLDVGDTVNIAVVNASGEADESPFTIRGVYSTGVYVYDDSSVLMPLAKAQTFAGTGERASAVIMLLHDPGSADRVAAALRSPTTTALTWRDLNEVFIQTMDTAMSFYVYLYGIVILIVAVIIANTLLMAVFERFREIGILAALGMRGRQITLMFLIEAALLGLMGVIMGNVLGSLAVAWLATYGIPMGDMGAVAGDMALGATLHARFNPAGMVRLSVWTLIVTTLAALYPAWYAARKEPVDALRAL